MAQRFYPPSETNREDQDPLEWGRCGWKWLDRIVDSYPIDQACPEVQHAMRDHLHSLRYLLPCSSCRWHVSQYLERFPLTDRQLRNQATLRSWIHVLHLDISRRLKRCF